MCFGLECGEHRRFGFFFRRGQKKKTKAAMLAALQTKISNLQ